MRFRKSAREKALFYLNQVIDQYPTTPAAAKARVLLSNANPPSTNPTTQPTTLPTARR